MKTRKADVAIVGGGSAGLAAALAAARQGAEVVLIERDEILGGMATTAQVHSLCGLYLLRSNESEPLLYANAGFPKEFAEALLAMGAARGPVRMGRLDVLLHRPSAFAQLAGKMVAALPNLRVCFQSEVVEVQRDGKGRIGSLGLVNNGSRSVLEVSTVVDTSGDAVVAALTGASFESASEEKLQRPALIFLLHGVASDAMSEEGRLRLAHAISTAVMNKQLPEGTLGAAFRAGVSPEEVWGTIDLQARGFDPTHNDAVALLEREARELAIQLMDFLKKQLPDFHSATIAAWPARLGIRESRRMKGCYQLTESDLLQGARFEDEVALASWPIELRETAKGPRFRFPEENRPCGIPLRSLRSCDLQNLFMAGRCIASSHEAQAAIRVIGTCLATGEAAGKAAAESVASPRHS